MYVILQKKQLACEYFLTFCFSRGGVVSASPNPQAGGPPLVGCPRLLIQFIRSYPPYRRPFLHPQLEDATCRGDRDPQTRTETCTRLITIRGFSLNTMYTFSLNFSYFGTMLTNPVFRTYFYTIPIPSSIDDWAVEVPLSLRQKLKFCRHFKFGNNGVPFTGR